LRNEVQQLRNQNKELTKQLQTAQVKAGPVQQPQQRLPQAPPETPPQPDRPRMTEELALATSQANICVNNLRLIEGAKGQWANQNPGNPNALLSAGDLLPYLPQHMYPACPAGGNYTVNALNAPPTCTVAGHAIQ
jgi:hypothetical protein